MPNSYIFEHNGGLGPLRLPSSAADREEASIRRAMDLAKLRSLEMAPEQEERLFRQRQQEFNTQTDLAQHGLTLQERGQNLALRSQEIDMRGQDVTQRGQDLQYDITRRGQELGMRESQERNQTALVERLYQLAGDPNTNLDVLSEFARTKGEEGLAKSLERVQDKVLDKEAQKFVPLLVSAKNTDPTSYMTQLENAKKQDPRIVQKIRDSLPPDLQVDLDPTKPGVQKKAPVGSGNLARDLGSLLPLVTAPGLAKSVMDKAPKVNLAPIKKTFKDLWRGATSGY